VLESCLKINSSRSSLVVAGRNKQMLGLLATFGLSCLVFNNHHSDDWSIEYDITVEGPRVVYEGTARLHLDQSDPLACMEYQFDVPENYRLCGPAISSNPGEPMLAFDSYEHEGKTLQISWCRFLSHYHLFPVSVPRHFVFFVMRTEFGPDDVLKLLSDWDMENSPWDLNNDGIVNGPDLTILLGGWKNNEGTS
jgi:hypothetical protein